jgi:hypothetical protein
LYWLTIFGKELVLAFGESKLMALPGVQAFSLNSQQIAICLNEPVIPDHMEQRLQTESQLADMLGTKYFFDRNKTDLNFEPVPQLAEVLKDISSTNASKSAKLAELQSSVGAEVKENFESQVILSFDGIPYTNPQDLAEVMVVFLHTEIEEIFTYSRSAIEALNVYFNEHPQRLEYQQEHLVKAFIPALGAYVGEVLVRELRGEWVVKEPLLKSTVIIDGKEVSTFEVAYQVVYEDQSLLDVYDSIFDHLG